MGDIENAIEENILFEIAKERLKDLGELKVSEVQRGKEKVHFKASIEVNGENYENVSDDVKQSVIGLNSLV